jgi:hypothetical protein
MFKNNFNKNQHVKMISGERLFIRKKKNQKNAQSVIFVTFYYEVKNYIFYVYLLSASYPGGYINGSSANQSQ